MCTRVFLITGQQHACSVPIKLSSENSNLGHRLADGKIAETRQIHLMAKRQIGFDRRRFGTLRYWHENCLYQETSKILYEIFLEKEIFLLKEILKEIPKDQLQIQELSEEVLQML